MVLYVENPKDSTKKKPELISEFSKLARHIINTQQSIMFLIMKTKLSFLCVGEIYSYVSVFMY